MKYLTAILYCATPQINGSHFLKYRKIKDTDRHRQKFETFCRKFPGARHINYYDKKTKEFIEQIKLT